MKNTPKKTPKRVVIEQNPNIEMQVARGRLKGLLNNIVDPEPEPPSTSKAPTRGRQKKAKESTGAAYIIKLFDRMVNVSEFDETSPLYPIVRAWFYDRKNEQLAPPKRNEDDIHPTYYNGRESLVKALKSGRIDRVAALPPPSTDEEVQRIPYCEPPSMENGLNSFTEDYDWNNPIISTEELRTSYLDRWVKVRQAWNLQSHHYSQRYEKSQAVLEAIAKK